ncbi:metal ABC transporter ATP-binding protein [Ornithinibacillus californiensis]|uniref:metal ABC transporter ATP-binding protein n=1 Tax=Ornithinibacillus californiensis TaxID=161536 RepID=UPI00064DE47E|nr:metal ABC transporter ATP-binding protein [Ornithinibacillus californiensis]
MNQDTIITLRNINYSIEKKNVLHDVNFELPKGAFVGLLGPNGGGKTTLTKIILGMLKPTSGNVTLFNKPLEEFNDWTKIGFVSQKSNSFNREFPATVYEVVSTGLTSKVGYFKFFNRYDKEKILQAIDAVGMNEYTRENIGKLSGGQQQRVFIARALVSEPELLILDEPTVGVDSENVQRFYELLHDLNQNKGITLLLITHDTGTMTKYASNVACLNKTLHFHGKPEEYEKLTEREISKFYGHPVNIVSHDH